MQGQERTRPGRTNKRFPADVLFVSFDADFPMVCRAPVATIRFLVGDAHSRQSGGAGVGHIRSECRAVCIIPGNQRADARVTATREGAPVQEVSALLRTWLAESLANSSSGLKLPPPPPRIVEPSPFILLLISLFVCLTNLLVSDRAAGGATFSAFLTGSRCSLPFLSSRNHT